MGMEPAGSQSLRGLRTVRAAVFTAVCVALSSGGHVLLSGSPLPLAPLLTVTAAVFLAAFTLAGGERTFGRIAALFVPLELVADTVFTTGQHACYGQAGGPVTGPLRAFGVDLLCGGGSLGTPLARLTSQGGETAGGPVPETVPAAPWLLLAVHIGIGLTAAAWLRRGDAALAKLLQAAAATAFRPLRAALAGCSSVTDDGFARTPRAGYIIAPLRTQSRLTHSVHRRGPPAVLLAA